MNIITRFASLALLLLAACTCQAAPDKYPRSLTDWTAVPAPSAGSADFQQAKFSRCDWHVFLRDGQPQVTLDLISPGKGKRQHSLLPFKFGEDSETNRDRTFYGRQFTTKVDDGWLVGFNAGEFGASLWWFSPDGHRRYKISDDQVVEFLVTPMGLIALQGLAHLMMSEGSIIKLTKNAQGGWQSMVLAPLGDAPEAAALDADGSLLVLTTRRQERVLPSGEVRVLLRDGVWWGFYPNSMVRARSGDFYVGMRYYVVRVRTGRAGTRLDWLLPSG